MSLYDDLIAALPELENSDAFNNLAIILQDDSDGEGAYIVKWEYTKPLPDGFSVGKPTV